MQPGVEQHLFELAGASRDPAPPWVVLPLCAVIAVVGLAVLVNFRGVPERLHEHWRGGRQGRLASFGFQRHIGAWMALGGLWGFLATSWQLIAD